MAVDDEVKIVITAEDKASGVLGSLGQKVGGLSGIFKGLATVGLTAATAALGALGTVAYQSIKSFDESQKVTSQLDAVLKSTGGSAGVTKQAVLDLSKELQKQTTYSDEAVVSAENMLLTFTKIGQDVFPDATRVVLDMSTALGQDTKSSAIELGKALQDPILGVTALRRVGVNFSEDQVNVIKNLVETGHQLDAQKMILSELTTEFGGSAGAATDSFSGKMLQLGNAVDDLKETIGAALITAITPFITQLTDWAQKPETQDQIQAIAQKVAQLATNLAPLVQKLFPAFIQILGLTVNTITFLGKAFDGTTNFLADLIFGVMQFIDDVKSMIDWVKQAIDLLDQLASKTAGGVKSGISNIGNGIANIFRAAGGPVSAGSPYIVGEQGPELFMPSAAGSIIPNSSLGGSNVVINITGTFLSQDAADQMANMMFNRLKMQVRL
ncbi:MAG TPA: phage tail length tape measure family protein [Patescibacteria group bacterium]|nr:phage tail length tape measure family protein [Patescibacteria group bacterium]